VEASETNENMSSLPPALDFPAMETAIVAKWKEEDTFHTQDALSLERGDKVRIKYYGFIYNGEALHS
jgi:hypothetical protein